jgi:hypothetical protein
MLANVPPSLLAIILISALLALLPTRRLYHAGHSQRLLTIYFMAVWVVSIAVAWAPGATRLIVPILVVAWLAPFVTLRSVR